MGQLRLAHTISTPLLYPVVALVTGPTPRGGGLWKYILQANGADSLLRRNLPVMSQVLHFLDFRSNNQDVLKRWRSIGWRERYRAEITPSVEYSAPLFLDSGGYKLLWSDSVDLSRHGLSIGANGPFTILQLQQDFGGDIVATFDYPLPPGLVPAEVEERSKKSIENAVIAARHLSGQRQYRPFLFVAAHGQDGANMRRYVHGVLRRFREEGIHQYPFGFAVGSLVPLRGSKKYTAIIGILRGLREAIPDDMWQTIPVHVFGMTGNLVPILAYLGVDSFDSSTYVQEARALGYIDPAAGRPCPALELDQLKCTCRICQKLNLDHLHNALTSDLHHRPQSCGHYKSKYYADIALHNLEMDFRIVEETRRAIQADSLQDYLLEHVARHPSLKPALDELAGDDDSLRRRLARMLVVARPTPRKQVDDMRAISLKYTPDSFNILLNGYHPPYGKRILLIIPCSGGKPYSMSRSHRLITDRLSQAVGDRTTTIHKITLSGLYGPVPEECEDDDAVLRYDFRLDPSDDAQIDLVADRLARYIARHREHYDSCLGYATSQAYRAAIERAAARAGALCVLPRKPRSRRLTEFFRQQNVEELVQEILAILEA
jgi:7-cyano-7-deazaguanine tRNA-ribosyltransferase